MLPDEEVQYLQSHPNPQTRLRALFEAGWSLASIGDSLTPPRPKSTLYYQIKNAPYSDTTTPLPTPTPKNVHIRPISPQIPKTKAEELARLAALARNCRAKTPSSSPYRVANNQLTELVTALYLKGVPVNSIARAAKVSSRAMFRRVSKGIGNINNV